VTRSADKSGSRWAPSLAYSNVGFKANGALSERRGLMDPAFMCLGFCEVKLSFFGWAETGNRVCRLLSGAVPASVIFL